MDPRLAAIWRFIRGDAAPTDFERWVYSDPTLEGLLGRDLYLSTISARYSDQDAVSHLRGALEQFARGLGDMPCECIAIPHTAVLSMADPGRALEHFVELRARGEPYWWLHLSRCSACGGMWLVAQEERQNDVFILRRLEEHQASEVLEQDAWPPDFDRYETLLRLGKAAGHAVRFLDPVGDSSLRWTIRDLARERPGIRLSELADLLNLDAETATILAQEAILRHGAEISLE